MEGHSDHYQVRHEEAYSTAYYGIVRGEANFWCDVRVIVRPYKP